MLHTERSSGYTQILRCLRLLKRWSGQDGSWNMTATPLVEQDPCPKYSKLHRLAWNTLLYDEDGQKVAQGLLHTKLRNPMIHACGNEQLVLLVKMQHNAGVTSLDMPHTSLVQDTSKASVDHQSRFA